MEEQKAENDGDSVFLFNTEDLSINTIKADMGGT